METIYPNITIEHLGQEATKQDLREFNAAVEAVMASTEFDRDAEGATEFVWNNGSIRFDAAACIYCDHVVPDKTIVPAPGDDTGWAELTGEHLDDCEWIATRAHTRLDGVPA